MIVSIAITILAGGRSSRFGQDKRFFNLSGKSLIQIGIKKAESLNLKIYLSVDKNFPPSAEFCSTGCNLIVDDYPYEGPLAAIVSTLRKKDLEYSWEKI
jgi:molybdopterin-guanine dinucleotide biosynthesis protein A